jgi:hypothetical protein
MAFIIKFILVTVAMFLTDVCWTMYFVEVEKRKSLTAGIWGSAILLFGSIVTINYVDDHRLLVAAIIGSFLGIVATIEYKKRKENKTK